MHSKYTNLIKKIVIFFRKQKGGDNGSEYAQAANRLCNMTCLLRIFLLTSDLCRYFLPSCFGMWCRKQTVYTKKS